MVLYVRSGPAEGLDSLVGDDDAVLAWLTDDAWEADKLWPVALHLLFGRGAIDRLAGGAVTEEAGYTPVMRMSAAAAAALAASIAQVDEAVLAARFDAGGFPVEFGPEVHAEDREWLLRPTLDLADLLRGAADASHKLAWVIA